MEQEIISGYRLSPQQRKLWLQQQGSAAYRVQCAVMIRGDLQLPLLKRAFQRVINQHEILHSAFRLLPGLDVPFQVIVDPSELSVREIDFSSWGTSEQQTKLDELMREERAYEFDYSRGQLLRACLVTLSPKKHALIITVSAMCADTWSVKNIVRDISRWSAESLTDEQALSEAVQYADFSEWQNELLESDDTKEATKYWKAQYEGASRLDLHNESKPPATRRYEPGSVVSEIDTGTTDKLNVLADREEVTVPQILLACWGCLLWRLTQQPDILIEAAFDGRKYEDLNQSLGLFTRYLPIRYRFEECSSFGDILRRLNRSYLDAYEWQEYFAWEQVQAIGWDETTNAAHSIGFDCEELTTHQEGSEGLSFASYRLYGCMDRFKLKLSCFRMRDGFRLELHFDTAFYDSIFASRILSEFIVLLQGVLDNRNSLVLKLPLLNETQLLQVLMEWNDTATKYSAGKCIHELFEEQVRSAPANIAVAFKDRQITYDELNRRANQLAHHLGQLGFGPDMLAGLYMDRSIEMIVGLLGALKAGGAYMPLDPTSPGGRSVLMLQDAKVKLLLTNQSLFRSLPANDAQVICLDRDWEVIGRHSEDNPTDYATADNLAYVIHTSGSTGRPKGVMIQHRSVVSLCTALSDSVYSNQGSQLRVSLNAPLIFDASVKQLVQLLMGNTLEIVPEEVRRDGPELLHFIMERRIDVFDCTPSQVRVLLDAGLADSGCGLPQAVLIGGEEIDDGLWQALGQSKTAYFNLYGPTECTVDSTVSIIDVNIAQPTIGRPIANIDAYILDGYLNPVPVGVTGALHIGGISLARGYFNQPDATAERFIPDPFSDTAGARLYETGDLSCYLCDGRIKYLGRADHQIKIRGYRIEPREIEGALLEHPAVREAIVLALEYSAGDKRLVGYVVAKQPNATTIEGHSRYRLPNGMAIVQQNRNETDYLYQEIFEEQTYLKHGISLPPGGCVFDVGANIGMFTLFVAHRCPDARVYAFEPIKPIFETLRINARLYGPDVKVFECGLSDREKPDIFTYYPKFSARSGLSAYADAENDVDVIKTFLRNKQQTGSAELGGLLDAADELLSGLFESESHRCTLRRLSDIITEERVDRIDLLKIDVQRAEMDVLKGIEEEDWEKIDQIVMEVHDAEGQASEGRTAEIVRMLQAHRYEVVAEQDDSLRGTDRYGIYAIRRGRTNSDIAGSQHLQPLDRNRQRVLTDENLLHLLPNQMGVFHQNRNETEFIYKQIFEDEIYLRHGISLKPGDCVFDVGANIGLFTLFVYQKCVNPNVYSFEPIPSNYEKLRSNVALYGLNAKLFNCGLSERNGTAAFTFYPNWSAGSGAYANIDEEEEALKIFLNSQGGPVAEYADQLIEERYQAEQVVCEIRTMSEIISQHNIERIDLLKLDVEKSELDILNGLAERDWPKIKQIVIEVHDIDDRLNLITGMLERQGFVVIAEQDLSLRGSKIYNLYATRYSRNVTAGPRDRRELSGQVIPTFGQAPLSPGDLQDYLKQRLPEYMVPAAILMIDSVPLTANGKLDRRGLPGPEQLEPIKRVTAPRTPIEEILVAIWAEVLRLKDVDVEESFFEIGGHSLLATQLISRVRSAFHVEVPLRSLFEAPTISEFAKRVEAGLNAKRPLSSPIIPVKREGVIPLSYAQNRLWVLNQLEPCSPYYNSPSALRMKGKLQIEALEKTLSEVVRRHDVLRTRFEEDHGRPLQVVMPAEEVRLEVIDLEGMAEEEREEEAKRIVAEDAGEGFDLRQGPLWRAKLVRMGDEEHILTVTMHHIVTDEWSIWVLVREMGLLYDAYTQGRESPLEELKIQYADYAFWQREWLTGEELGRQLNYWTQKLEGVPAIVGLPTDRPRPAVQTHRGARQSFTLNAEVAESLKGLSRREVVTTFMALLAAWQVLLMRYSRQKDIVVGTPIANRNRQELEGLIGFFVNTLVLRSDLSGELSFVDLLRKVRETCLEAYAHQDLPFEKLVDEVRRDRDLSHTELFQAAFVLQNAPVTALELSGLALSSMAVDIQAAKFDMTLMIHAGDESFSGSWEYNTDLFDHVTISRMISHFQNLLDSIVADPQMSVTRLPILKHAQRQHLLNQWTGVLPCYPKDRSLHKLFEQQVERSPHSVAVLYEQQCLTYGELNRRANQLACYLIKLGVGTEIRVGLSIERSVEMIVALLAILKAGAAYVPLDPRYPERRLTMMLEDSEIAAVIVQRETKGSLTVKRSQVIDIDSIWEEAGKQPEDNPETAVDGDNLAYVIYTSGSTGRPKGAMITHYNVVRLIEATEKWYRFNEGDVWTLFHSYGFDFSVWEMWGALARGGRLVVVPYEVSREAGSFYELICDEGVTVLNQTPSAFRQLMEVEETRGVSEKLSLRLVIFGGEALEMKSLRGWYRRHEEGKPRLINMYGITETTVHVSYREVKKEEVERGIGSMIGERIDDLEMLVLDEEEEIAGEGVPGELYVGGNGIGRGYEKRADMTGERFIPNPYNQREGERLYRTGDLGRYLGNGNIEYVGRIDDQVKVRGYRIELGEIESVLGGHEGVKQCAVVVRGEGGDKRLVGYVVKREGVETSTGEMRRYLRERLPEYMVPGVIVELEEMPVTGNGKLDRRRLPEAEEVRGEEEREEARTAEEEIVVGIWEEVLKVEGIGVEENFFELGGHSLLATQVMSRVNRAFGVEVGLRVIFEEPTVRGLAGVVERERRGGDRREVPEIRRVSREGELPLSYAQERLWFVQEMEPESASYNIPIGVRLEGQVQIAAIKQSMEEIARRHDVLRTRIEEREGRPVQVIEEAGEVELPIMDVSGLEEGEREEVAGEIGTEEASRVFDLRRGPVWRAGVIRKGEEEHELMVNMHHIASDRWSMGVMKNEFSRLYEANTLGRQSPLEQLEIQYSDYAVWQKQGLEVETFAKQLQYWDEQLRDLPILGRLTTGVHEAAESRRGATEPLELNKSLSEALKRLSRREDTTLFMVLHAAFNVLLSLFTAQDDIVVGIGVANRRRVQTEKLIGCFFNLLPIRTALSGDPSFRTILRRVRDAMLGAFTNQDIPFEKLVDLQRKRQLPFRPLFQVLFEFNANGERRIERDGLRVSPRSASTRTAKFDLTLFLVESEEGLSGLFEYRTDLFSADDIARMIEEFQTLLQNIVDDPDKDLRSLMSNTLAEKSRMLAAFNEALDL
jgi:amino acid adenylation domain-containing protein/FkbM family methyltransferase